MKQGIRVLCVGDVVGRLGRAMIQKHLDVLRKEHRIDAVILNGENSADGKGITPRQVRFFRHNGVDIVTSGNHIWAKRDIYSYLHENKDLLRPANFPSDCPGSGVGFITTASGTTIGVINVQGRVFMNQHLDCPFRTVQSLLTYVKSKTPLVVIDMHAETTSEKMGIGHFVDGQVSAVVGTHTHVPTADERILPGGTAFITDLGMTGALNSMLGTKTSSVLPAFLTQMPSRFIVEDEGPAWLCGAYIDIDPTTGKALAIERVKIIDRDLVVGDEDVSSES